MSKEIVAVYNNDVVVYEDNTAYISQRKLAELLGVNENTLFKHIKSKHKNYNTSKGLDAFLVKKVSTYYAFKGYEKAQELVDKFVEAGATAYLYSLAGYKFKAEKPESIPLLSDEVRQAISTNTTERNTVVRYQELSKLVDQSIVVRVKRTRAYYEYHLTEKGKSLGFRTNRNGTILNPIGE